MTTFIAPATINILGGNKQTGTYQAKSQEQTDSKPSRWKKFKEKAKRAWKTAMGVAADIKDNLIPIFTGVGVFLTSLATFNRSRSNNRQWSAPSWAF